MKITTKYTHQVYETGIEEFYVETVRYINSDHNEQYDAWLWEESYGVKMLMFGAEIGTPDGCKTYGDFMEEVDRTLEEYIDVYRDEYMN